MRLRNSAAALLLLAGCAPMLSETHVEPERRAPADAAWPRMPCEAPAQALLSAGGGRPGTGYVGASAALCVPRSEELENGWFVDLNYTHSLAETVSVELSLGMLGYEVARSGDAGSVQTMALAATCQLGRAFGSVRWYVGAGVGYLQNEISGIAGLEAEAAFAGIASAGAEIPLTSVGSMVLELRYLVSRAELSAGDDLELDAFAVRVNYVFLY